MTVVDDSVCAEIRAVLVDFGVSIELADELASDHPVTAELVPVRLLLDELDLDPAQSRSRLASLVVRDELGLACVPGPYVKSIIAARDRRVAEALAEARAAALERRNSRRRRQPSRADLESQIDVLMDDDELDEHLQAMFVTSLQSKIRRLDEGDRVPDVIGTGVSFGGCSDEELAKIKRQDRREQREARYGRARRD